MGHVSLALLVEVLIAALVVGGVGALVAGRLPGLAEVPADDAGDGLPEGRLSAEDLERARFPLAFRGYRMADVDAVLDRLRGDLRERDEQIERLRAPQPVVAYDGAAPDGAPPDAAPASPDAALVHVPEPG